MTEKKPTLEYARPVKREPGYIATYWHLYAPFVILILIVVIVVLWGTLSTARS